MSKTPINYLDQPPADWFPIAVMKNELRGRDLVALMFDVHPDDLATRSWDNPVRLYVHPDKYCPSAPRGHHGYVRIPGKHRPGCWLGCATGLDYPEWSFAAVRLALPGSQRGGFVW